MRTNKVASLARKSVGKSRKMEALPTYATTHVSLATSVGFHHTNPPGLFRGGGHGHIGHVGPAFLHLSRSSYISRVYHSPYAVSTLSPSAFVFCSLSTVVSSPKKCDFKPARIRSWLVIRSLSIPYPSSEASSEINFSMLCTCNWNCHRFDVL